MSSLGLSILNMVQNRVAWLWVLMSIWMAFVGYRAWIELESSPTVMGLHRTYHAPYEHDVGWVIDPRQNGLIREVLERYAPDQALEKSGLRKTDYTTALSYVGLTVEVSDEALGAQSDPHLRTTKDGAGDHLFIGQFGLDFVLFYPQLGVVLSDELPPALIQLRLVGASEAPW